MIFSWQPILLVPAVVFEIFPCLIVLFEKFLWPPLFSCPEFNGIDLLHVNSARRSFARYIASSKLSR